MWVFTARYDSVRLLAQLPHAQLVAAVETKPDTLRGHHLVTYFVIEMLDAVARQRSNVGDGVDPNLTQTGLSAPGYCSGRHPDDVKGA